MTYLTQFLSVTLEGIILIVFVPQALVWFGMFYLYQCFCGLLIRRIHGDNFVELMTGSDSFWMLSNRNVINILLEVEPNNSESESNLTQDVKDRFSKFILSGRADKLTYTLQERFGFAFWKRRKNFDLNVNIKEVKIENTLDECSLSDLVSKICDADLPEDNFVPWEIVVINKPIFRDGDPGKSFFLIVVRFHHSLCDGLSCMKLLLNTIISDSEKSEKITSKIEARQTNFQKLRRWVQMPVLVAKNMLTPVEKNPLHGPKLQESRHIVWHFHEDDGLQKIMAIKKNSDGASFTDIILGAVSVSCHKYFQKVSKGQKIPKKITLSVSMRSGKLGLVYDEESFDLTNMSIGSYKTIPVLPGNLNNNQTLLAIKQYQDNKAFMTEALINEWMLKYITSITPLPFLRLVTPIWIPTLFISNLPGFSKSDFANGRKLKNIAFILNSMSYTGVGLTVFTYDKKIQFGLAVDKALMENREDAVCFMREILNEIDRLYYNINKNIK